MNRTLIITFTDGSKTKVNWSIGSNEEELKRTAFYHFGKIVDSVKEIFEKALIL